MDGVSGVAAVVSLTIQLAGTVKNIKAFFREIRNVSKELLTLLQLLNLLDGCFNHVRALIEQQNSILSASSTSLTLIVKALVDCETILQMLESFVNKAKSSLVRRNQLQRTWASLRIMSKKEDIQELQNQLRDATMALHLAISINSALQINHMQILTAPVRRLDTGHNEERSLCSPGSRRAPTYTVNETNSVWSRNSRMVEKKAVTEESVVMIMASFMKLGLELRFMKNLGRIPRTLNVYPIMPRDSEVFYMCQDGDIEGLQIAFSNGSVSPFVLDEDGESLLYYAVFGGQKDLCSMLLQLGLDPDRASNRGWKPFESIIDLKISGNSIDNGVDILRILMQAQDDLSTSDVSRHFRCYLGPPEGLEIILLHDAIQDDFNCANYALATALAQEHELLRWEPVIRKLIRKGVDLHAPVPPSTFYSYKYATPLDELFTYTETPYEARVRADDWLQILASEECDVLAYLLEEFRLHETRQQFTYSSRSAREYRQLVFELGSNPSVYWDWWIDPESPALSVCEEFQQMNNICPFFEPASYEVTWPFNYPACPAWWSKLPSDMAFSEWDGHEECARKLAQERADRRLEKRTRRRGRAQALKERLHVPGAWPV